MQSTRALLGHAPLLLGILACGVASAADGSGSAAQGQLSASARANPVPPSLPAQAPPQHRPPQEAFDACKSLAEGAACSMSFNGRTMTGTCRKGPNGESELACVPARPPGPPPSGSNQTLSGTALERTLDRLEREIQGS